MMRTSSSMRKSMRGTRVLLSGCLLLVASVSQAATISNLNAPWPASPDVQTIDALSVTNSNRAIHTTRVDRQSFSVATDVTVGEIFLSAANYNDLAFNLEFFEVVNVNQGTGNGGLAGAANVVGQVGSTITVVPQGSIATGSRNLRITLDPAERFALPALPSPGGYLLAVSLVDTTSTTAAFNWVHSNTGVDIYTAGRMRRDDGDQTNTRDFGLALVPAVPEPSSAIMALSGLALLTMRRRK